MKKLLIILLILLSGHMTAGAQAGRSDWMAGLSDDTPVCRLAIPGTHDSGTAGVRFPARRYARTQNMDIGEQWDAGIRFFDLRPKLTGGELRIYHGPANCHITFSEALLVLRQKLEQNPTEFCIVMTNNAGGGQASVDMTMEVISNDVPAGMIAAFNAHMTVADIRGRILFIHRGEPSDGIRVPGVVTRGWPGNGLSKHTRMVSAKGESAPLWVQDFFTSGDNDGDGYLNRKWEMTSQLLRDFTGADGTVWCINHTSGYTGTGIRTNIKRNAGSTNSRLHEYLQTGTAISGIVPMDFPSRQLIDAIIDCNLLYLSLQLTNL